MKCILHFLLFNIETFDNVSHICIKSIKQVVIGQVQCPDVPRLVLKQLVDLCLEDSLSLEVKDCFLVCSPFGEDLIYPLINWCLECVKPVKSDLVSSIDGRIKQVMESLVLCCSNRIVYCDGIVLGIKRCLSLQIHCDSVWLLVQPVQWVRLKIDHVRFVWIARDRSYVMRVVIWRVVRWVCLMSWLVRAT